MDKSIGEAAWNKLVLDAHQISGEDGHACPTWVDAVLFAHDSLGEAQAAVLREKRRVDSLHECISQRDAEIDRLRALLLRYRNETPLGHQPHMIASEVDAARAAQEGE